MIICLNARNQENLLGDSKENASPMDVRRDGWDQFTDTRCKKTCKKLKVQSLLILQDL